MESPMTRNNIPRIKSWRLLLFFFCFGVAVTSCAQTDPTQSDPDRTQSTSNADKAPNIAIGAGDQLDIEIFDTPELSGSARVSQTGEINLTVLGSIQVAGLTPNQAARKIESELKSRGLLIDPHVTVAIAEYATQGATVTGEVHSPGLYPTLGSRRLLDMIALAGGVLPTAGRTASVLQRDDPHNPRNIVLVPNNNALSAQENPVISPGDTVVIDKASIVYILGDVGKAGGYLVDNNERLSLIQALTLAGGWTRTSAQSKVILIRQVPEGREEIKLDLRHVVHGEQADIKMSNGDILFVPSSLGKIFAYQGVGAVVNGAEQALVYGTIYR